jgi:hypothetical protein
LDLKDQPELLDLQGLKDLKDYRVHLEPPVQQDLKDNKDQLDQLVLQGLKDLKVNRDHPG